MCDSLILTNAGITGELGHPRAKNNDYQSARLHFGEKKCVPDAITSFTCLSDSQASRWSSVYSYVSLFINMSVDPLLVLHLCLSVVAGE